MEDKLTLAPIFKESMVLQRDRFFALWGTAKPGAQVVAGIQGRVKFVTADAEGRWRAVFEMLRTSYDETISVVCGEDQILLREILVGEVFVVPEGAAPMKRCQTLERELLMCKNAYLRFLVDTEEGPAWHKCTASELPGLSEAGYFRAKEIWEGGCVPVGIIETKELPEYRFSGPKARPADLGYPVNYL